MMAACQSPRPLRTDPLTCAGGQMGALSLRRGADLLREGHLALVRGDACRGMPVATRPVGCLCTPLGMSRVRLPAFELTPAMMGDVRAWTADAYQRRRPVDRMEAHQGEAIDGEACAHEKPSCLTRAPAPATATCTILSPDGTACANRSRPQRRRRTTGAAQPRLSRAARIVREAHPRLQQVTLLTTTDTEVTRPQDHKIMPFL